MTPPPPNLSRSPHPGAVGASAQGRAQARRATRASAQLTPGTPGRRSIHLGVLMAFSVLALPSLAAGTPSAELNPYGLQAMWRQGDLVSRSTLILLVLMSVATWATIVARAWDQQRVLGQARRDGPGFWQASSLAEGAAALPRTSVLGFIAAQGLAADAQHRQGLAATVDHPTWIGMRVERAVGRVQSQLQRGLALLATVASTAPFVGLFGTVWGIYHALVAIGVSGQASIDKVAGPVGEALIMTAIGLAVAVPAVMGHNALVRRNKLVMDEVRAFGADLQEVLIAGSRQRTP